MPAATAPTIDDLITQCPSAEVLDAIDEDFDIRFEMIDVDGDGTPDDPAPEGNALRCTAAQGSRDLTQSQERLYQVLIAFRAIEFDASLTFTDKNLYEWLTDSIEGIRIRSDVAGSFCCTPPDDAIGNYINIQNGPDRSVFVTDLFDSLFFQMQLFVHEAQHVYYFPHVCEGGNDASIDEGGSWAAVYHFSRGVAFDSDACFVRPSSSSAAADSYLLMARDYSRQVHRFRFCAEPTVPVEPPEPVFACGL
jgi:hypothetical protein